jgi:hypothetical protein
MTPRNQVNRRQALGAVGSAAAVLCARSLTVAAHPATKPKTGIQSLPAKTPQNGIPTSLVLRGTDSGTPLSGCFRIRPLGSKEWLALPNQLNRKAGLSKRDLSLGWHVTMGATEFVAPRGSLEIEAFSGIDTPLVRKIVDSEADIKLVLPDLLPDNTRHWVAGNTHVHLRRMTRPQVNRYLTEIPMADGLKVVFVSYLERALASHTYITNEYTPDDLHALNRPGKLIFGPGEEYRHNFGPGAEGYGHVMFLDLAKKIIPASVGPGITLKGTDGTPLQPAIRIAHDRGATVVWCHNAFGTEDIPNWLAGNVQAQNIFDGGNHGSYEDSHYRYLNLGIRAPFSTGTDWFIYDFSRVYVRADPGRPLTTSSWLDGLKRGRSLITNGPWLDFSINGRQPGDVTNLKNSQSLDILGSAVGRHDFGTLQLVRNGRIVQEQTAKRTGNRFTAEISGPNWKTTSAEWWALRINPREGILNEMGKPLFAHTSPIYFDYQGSSVFDRDVAHKAIEEMQASKRSIQRHGKFAGNELAKIHGTYDRGIAQLKRRLSRL